MTVADPLSAEFNNDIKILAQLTNRLSFRHGEIRVVLIYILYVTEWTCDVT